MSDYPTKSDPLDYPEDIKIELLKSKVLIIHSKFNNKIVDLLLSNVENKLKKYGLSSFEKVAVPGAFEIPFVAHKFIKTGKFDAIICLGAIMRGETSHYDLLCKSVFESLSRLSISSDIPIINGILTTENEEQAMKRISNAEHFVSSCLNMLYINLDSYI